ncbi:MULTISPECIES: septal ring lytic transglycosylase RlpA family protein [Ralstonia solanacearum species complex]|uniref:septal ring lytic transglycosylase RlpA family protein n=1 Tax=Ralstonia solanacearum species complex TaxID=3116862 RepID=UPI000E592581|nr:septal ring lytic transglycosylase RlpA family protein [Ralstonia solanacearum]BEU70617.1 septal ring lytic transglycosylase RlpA family protein [Ralstonia pseudosolanacearum]AXV75658.1 septal ring lytic transglycosylase RlpA family lipoprotein [Ralstonia solanacearum]AXV89658.1 septal ring lytic transglycosylase RlpA family lipoprotein [Ralstonia solanacearum]AXW17864.1 septal ring lytic transglycosylase RlpA family lipoprotein [Ralstonia solanacearum]AXW74571.1 septal ring lytic transglyc
MLKLTHPLTSPSAGRTLRAWLLHGATLMVLAGCAAVPGEPPSTATHAPAPRLSDTRDNPDAWGTLAFRGVPESNSLQMAPADTEPGLRADLGTFEQRGLASWYGRGFHGRRTASGERFDMNAFTVAHPSLPLSSWVLVRNLSNDRVVVAKVTDRGPYHGKRIIDLSYAAAKRLDFVRRGSTQVEIRRLSRAEVEALRPELTQTDVASNNGDADMGADEPAPPGKKAVKRRAKAHR